MNAMNRKQELEIVLSETLKYRQRVYRLRHDMKISLLKGDKSKWLADVYLDTVRTLNELNASIKAIRDEIKGL